MARGARVYGHTRAKSLFCFDVKKRKRKKRGPVNWHGLPVSMGTLVPNLSRHARDRAKGHAACRGHIGKKIKKNIKK